MLNIKELSSIIHFPHARFNQNPRLDWQKGKIVPAPNDLPNEWIVVWYNNYGWEEKEIRITDKDRFRHIYILWQTWTWKSTIMYAQAVDDMDHVGDLHLLIHTEKPVNIFWNGFPKRGLMIWYILIFEIQHTQFD